MNWLDSARILAALSAAGNTTVKSFVEADTVLVNSCTVTASADKKSLTEAKKVVKAGKRLVIFGCSANLEKLELQERFPSGLIFDSEKSLLEHFDAPLSEIYLSTSSRTRIPVAIQTGCDCGCTFCITKFARGRHRNFPVEQILSQIQNATKLGTQEIVLTGINVGAFGCSNTNKADENALAELLTEILEKTRIPRIRISSLGPQYLDKKFFEAFQNPRICDHLHLSVQSGSNTVLRKMNRSYTRSEVLVIADKAKAARPNVALAADIIVGFPGESEQNFIETYELVKKIEFAKLHVFPFSPRQGTPAEKFPDQIPELVKKARAEKLRKLGDQLREKFIESQLGNELEVLVEKDETGLTSNYIRAKVPGGKENEIKKIKLEKKIVAKDTFV